MNVTADIYERISELKRGALATFCELLTITNRDTLTTTIADNTSHVMNTWTGPNGNSGIILPPVSESEGRIISFHSDSTISANKYIRLRPATADTSATIDGAATYDFDRAFDGISVLCDGSNWFIIQKKEK